jgi:pantoate--beta-alanine ligase
VRVITGLAAAHEAVLSLRKKGSVGFVPTMGALHEGHASLVRRAKRENRSVVVSIFVNPLQFGPKEDLRRYPHTLAADKKLLMKAGAHLVFVPSADVFYASDFQTTVEVKGLTRGLCGRSRPGHFTGVATVVLKLLNLVPCDRLYLGQKDYQQYRVIAQMIKDLSLPVEVRLCPIVREPDGLAMSSRNAFLSKQERTSAAALNRALVDAAEAVRSGARKGSEVTARMRSRLGAAPGARLDYAELVDAESLEPVVILKPGRTVLAAAAVYYKKARLIDNRLIGVKR